MNTRKMQFERVIKYSIRKFSVGVGSAVIGTFLLGANNFLVETVAANEVATPNQVHYRYLAEQELTEAEKALIHHELPSDLKQDDVVYLVYRKKEVNFSTIAEHWKQGVGTSNSWFCNSVFGCCGDV